VLSPSTARTLSRARTRERSGLCGSAALTYTVLGLIAVAMFESSVHGVVVHTSNEISGSSLSGNRTKTEGSVTVL
jgi:hypothetical protein